MRRESPLVSFVGFGAVLFLACYIFSAGTALGQASTSVTGTVTDPRGAVLVGSAITLTNMGTAAARQTQTNAQGVYQFQQVLPGMYSIEGQSPGFKSIRQENIQLLVDTPATIDLQFKETGAVKETVVIEGEATLLNKTDATIGNTFTARQIVELPLNARNVVNLLSLQPQVTPTGYVAGGRSDQSNLTLDGVDVNDQQSGTAFTPVLRVTPDSVQEFRVTITNANAIQGRSSGAQVSLITKGGTNQFKGSLYWFNRNTVFTANDFFNNRSGVPRPKLNRNLYGGSIGGPIVRDRAFFFYNYEGRRDASEQSAVRTVPLSHLGQGQVRYINTSGRLVTLTTQQLNMIYPVGVNPVAVAALAQAASKYPANDTTVGDGINIGGFRFNAPLSVKENTHTARVDVNLTRDARHVLSLRGNYQWDNSTSVPQFPDTPVPSVWSHPIGFVVGHIWTISPRMVNNFRYGITRQAFSNQGDSAENNISFRFVFSPLSFTRTLSRTTPVHNFTNDFSWLRGNQTWQFGTNIRVIRNSRTSFARSYDSAITNPSFYDQSGAVVSNPITDLSSGSRSSLQAGATAVIGRYSQYSGNFNFGRDGSIQPVGQGNGRTFGTEEYDFYAQNTWRLRSNLTVTLGVRYGVNTPVYETTGFQVKPTTSLGEFFLRRVAGAAKGQPVNDSLQVDLAGRANDRPGYYDLDLNNWAPRASVAWSPTFRNGILRAIFGGEGKSVFRAGYSLAYDWIGSQLAVTFDLNNTLGFSSTTTVAANTYNVTDRPAPLFTGFNQVVRTLPRIPTPAPLRFPLMTPADGAERIESSLDDTLTTPHNHNVNFSIGRELPGGFFLEAAYIGRFARNLLATRDIMALNNLVDPKSGMDWYTAASILANLREGNVPITAVAPIPYFENLFPGYRTDTLTPTQRIYRLVARRSVGGQNTLDWTFVQEVLNRQSALGVPAFFHPQYAALSAFSTLANSDYHGGSISLRQRLRQTLLLDFNYTFAKSMDNASGLQTSGTYAAAFIVNPLRPEDNRGISDFDLHHIINANWLWQLPIGRGRAYLKDLPGFFEQVLGGWQLSGIFRWNSGLPVQTPFDQAQWATNWNVQSNGVRIRDVDASPTKSGRSPNLFGDPVAAYRSFRNAYPGETGDRNIFRNAGFVSVDFGLHKAFQMPYAETHRLVFRWEVFNATNTQRLGTLAGGRAGLGLDIDPHLGQPGPVFGNYTGIQGTPRIMQFGLRYEF